MFPRSEEVNITSLITTVTSLMTRKHSSAVAERVFKRRDAGVSCIPLTPAEESALGWKLHFTSPRSRCNANERPALAHAALNCLASAPLGVICVHFRVIPAQRCHEVTRDGFPKTIRTIPRHAAVFLHTLARRGVLSPPGLILIGNLGTHA